MSITINGNKYNIIKIDWPSHILKAREKIRAWFELFNSTKGKNFMGIINNLKKSNTKSKLYKMELKVEDIVVTHLQSIVDEFNKFYSNPSLPQNHLKSPHTQGKMDIRDIQGCDYN